MTNQIFAVGDRVFDDVLLEWGTAIETGGPHEELLVMFNNIKLVYAKDGSGNITKSRIRLHKSNPAQDTFEKMPKKIKIENIDYMSMCLSRLKESVLSED